MVEIHDGREVRTMNQKVIVKTGFQGLSDSQAIALAGAVIKGAYAEKASATPPVDQQTLQTALDDLNGAIVAVQAAGGGTTAIVVKNKKRAVLNGLLRKLAHYVQANCNDDVQFVTNSGFQAKTVNARQTTSLGKAQIQSVDNGHTTQLVVSAKKVAYAKSYQVQVAAVGANNTVGPFQTAGVFGKSRPMTLTGLTPGTIYAVQVRAVGGATGYGDWSDAVSHMCM
jgi:Fibronectin type III domain